MISAPFINVTLSYNPPSDLVRNEILVLEVL